MAAAPVGPAVPIAMPVIVAPIAQEVCDLVRGSSPGVEVSFVNAAGDATVMGDPTRLRQLFLNLVTNAIDGLANQWADGALRILAKATQHLNDDGVLIVEPSSPRVNQSLFLSRAFAIGIGKLLPLSLAADHRVVDGAIAASDGQRPRARGVARRR